MPITIGTLSSTVNVVDGNSLLTEEVLEQIVAIVMERVRQERFEEERDRPEREIRDRVSEIEPF